MGVLMSRKTLSVDDGDGSSIDGLLDDEPIVRELSGWAAAQTNEVDVLCR